KAYLKSGGDITELSQTRTLIGENGGEVIYDGSISDTTHAVVEYCQQEDCFVLHDLNTPHGTYVNDCRVQNAAVRLAPGDVIKCGFNGRSFQLVFEGMAGSTQYLPVQQRPSWTSPIQVMVSTPRDFDSKQTSLPLINISAPTSINPYKFVHPVRTTTNGSKTTVQPHPPLRYRPHSAGAANNQHSSNQLPREGKCAVIPDTNLLYDHSITTQRKDQKLLRMGDEINRLAVFEQESKRKDSIISNLREELSQLEDKISSEHFITGNQLASKLQSVEKEIESRRNEVIYLKRQLDSVNSKLHTSPTLTTQLSDKENKIHDLRQELDALKREHIMSQGLIQSLQKEISTKDLKLQKKTEELAHVKNELKQKDIQLLSISSKVGVQFTQLHQDKSKDELNSALTKEKLKSLDCRAGDQLELLQKYKEEVSKQQAVNQQTVEEKTSALKESEEFKQKYYEVQRQERLLRVDIEHSKSQLARFHTRCVRVVYSAPGIAAPDDLDAVVDDKLFGDLKKIIENRIFIQKLGWDMKPQASIFYATEQSTESHDKIRKLEDEDRISSRGHHTKLLSEESQVLLSTLDIHESLAWIFQVFASYMKSEKSWLEQVDSALCEAGYDVTISDQASNGGSLYIVDIYTELLPANHDVSFLYNTIKGAAWCLKYKTLTDPAVHISHLHQALLHEKNEVKKVVQSIADLESSHQMELQSHVNKLLKENEEKLADELERMRMQEKQEFEKSVEELRAKEEEKRLQALMSQQEKVTSANCSVDQLKQWLDGYIGSYRMILSLNVDFLLEEKNIELDEYKHRIQDAVQNIHELKTEKSPLQKIYKLSQLLVIKHELRTEMSALEKRYKLELNAVNANMEQLRKDFDHDLMQYKEEIHQHSITIVSLEEKLQQLNHKRKEAEEKIKRIESTESESQHREATHVPQRTYEATNKDVTILEQTIDALKLELSHSHRQLQVQQDTILGLKRDLSGAQSRMSDMIGELSESQKQELEHNRNLVKNQEVELNEIRQQLLKMSGLVDSQKEQIRLSQEQLRLNETKLRETNSTATELDLSLKEQHKQQEMERKELEKKNKIKEKEGKLSSELSSMGAQCRGERHEDVILKQREALAELRARVKALEQKELSEIRAKQAMEEDKQFQQKMSLDQDILNNFLKDVKTTVFTLLIEVVDAHQQIKSATTQASIERTTREQIEESVKCSERCYMDLMNSVGGMLGINAFDGMSSLQHAPQDERERLSANRRADLEKITLRIKSLIQRLDRKEQLLQGYEKDLTKLREAETFASQKSGRLEVMSHELMEKAEEVKHLREALVRCREALELEKRLNKMIKQRK
uniref:FHA domain-containing protein n=1 Tax=Ciona intestinalis TaxID=7719 RepID=F6PVU0_CIOIN